MLNIAENSWHYKVAMTFREQRPKSLCTYFWSFVFTILASLVMGVFGGALATILLGVLLDPVLTYGLAWWVGVEPTHTFLFGHDLSKSGAFTHSYACYIVLAVIGLMYGFFDTKIGNKLLDKIDKSISERKKAVADGAPLSAWEMFWQGVKAINGKVCPRITYVWK